MLGACSEHGEHARSMLGMLNIPGVSSITRFVRNCVKALLGIAYIGKNVRTGHHFVPNLFRVCSNVVQILCKSEWPTRRPILVVDMGTPKHRADRRHQAGSVFLRHREGRLETCPLDGRALVVSRLVSRLGPAVAPMLSQFCSGAVPVVLQVC